jgi:hypothetical protein
VEEFAPATSGGSWATAGGPLREAANLPVRLAVFSVDLGVICPSVRRTHALPIVVIYDNMARDHRCCE